jgi:hypothetical protein
MKSKEGKLYDVLNSIVNALYCGRVISKLEAEDLIGDIAKDLEVKEPTRKGAKQ